MSAPGRLVPWASWAEWAAVRAGLLAVFEEGSGNDDGPAVDDACEAAAAAALATVAAWRVRGRVPLGVDATAAFVEAELGLRARGRGRKRRRQGDGDGVPTPAPTPPPSPHAARLALAMAAVRLVNGVSDAGQAGRVARSVAALAAEAGLPRLLVDVRHEATHNELPPLPPLRLAAAAGVAWLGAAYWGAQADLVEARRGEVGGLLGRYWAARTEAAGKSLLPQGNGQGGGGAPGGGASTPPPTTTTTPDAARRHRRQLLGRLKDAVPPGLARLVAGAVVAGGAPAPPPHSRLSTRNR